MQRRLVRPVILVQPANKPVTHDVGAIVFPGITVQPVSIRPEVSDAKMGLASASVGWEERRDNMKDVCSACHSETWIDNFYTQYDGLVNLYNNKFAKPGLALYKAAKPLIKPVKFSNKLDFIWFELWHHEGRRARMGASMMGPDYTHWHGTYEVAKHFYVKYIPELETLIDKGNASGDAKKVAAAKGLRALLDKVLNTDDHKWFLGKMDSGEIAARKKAAAEFNTRYAK